ncbi:MAG: helix-turn-helix transcriptional regulator [Oscillospiraceae bacterium]|nr:helix-turn-helix transcriptional regulator [Oscillospiraceae bacterium]
MVRGNPILCEEASRMSLSLIHCVHAKLGTWWRKDTEERCACSQLYYIVKGEAVVICNGERIVMKEGNWYLLPDGVSVKYWCDDFMEEFTFHFKLCNIDRVDLLRNCRRAYTFPIKEDFTPFFSRCLESEEAKDALRLCGIIYDMLCRFIDEYDIKLAETELSPCVSKAVAHINKNLSMQLTVDEIAKASFVSKSTLEKYFKEELSCSVHGYLLNTVLFEAGNLLLKTSISIRNISERFGFCDQFYFSKCFKEKFGKSPKDFRKSSIV